MTSAPLLLGLAGIGLLCAILVALPTGNALRSLTLQGVGLLLSGLILLRAMQRAFRDRPARLFSTWLAAFGALSLTYRLGLLHRLLTQGPDLAVHPLRDALLWNLAMAMLLLLLMDLGHRMGPRDQAVPRTLDGLIFATAFYFLLWMGLLRPYLEASAVPMAFALSSQVLFGLSAGALGMALHLLLRGGHLRGPLPPLALALTGLTIVLSWSLAASFHQHYPLDHPARFLGLVALVPILVAVDRPLEGPSPKPWKGLNALPYVPAALAIFGFLAFMMAPHPRVEPFAVGMLGGLALLVLVRQGLTVLEVDHLNQTLEHKVEARTREVAELNALLLRTQGMNLVATLGAGLAHDLNNLLGSAAMEADLLAAPPAQSESALTPDVQRLQATLERAAELTQRLLRVGRAEEPPAVLDAAAHVGGLQPMLRALVPRAHMLHVEVAEGPLPLVCAPSQLDQIIVNLVVNARDALPRHGAIHVRLHPVPEGGLQLQVADTGSGIPDEVRARMFEPFFTTKAPGQGTGLGLGSVKAVVDSLGGQLHLQTQMGQGSCFTIRFPAA